MGQPLKEPGALQQAKLGETPTELLSIRSISHDGQSAVDVPLETGLINIGQPEHALLAMIEPAYEDQLQGRAPASSRLPLSCVRQLHARGYLQDWARGFPALSS